MAATMTDLAFAVWLRLMGFRVKAQGFGMQGRFKVLGKGFRVFRAGLGLQLGFRQV